MTNLIPEWWKWQRFRLCLNTLKFLEIHLGNLAVYLNLTLLNDRSHAVTSCTKCWRLWHWFWEKNINKKWAGIIRKNLHTSHTTSRKSERTTSQSQLHRIPTHSGLQFSLSIFLVGANIPISHKDHPLALICQLKPFWANKILDLAKTLIQKFLCSFILLQKVL